MKNTEKFRKLSANSCTSRADYAHGLARGSFMGRAGKSISILLAVLLAFSVLFVPMTASAAESAEGPSFEEGLEEATGFFQRIYNFILDIYNSIATFLGRDSCTKEPKDVIEVPDEADVVIEEDADLEEVFAEAEEGEVIFFMPGEYDFSEVEMDKPLTLLGPNHDIPAYSPDRHEEAKIITNSNENVTSANAADAMFTISASEVNISGFTIDGDNPDAEGDFNVNTGILFYGAGSKENPQGDLDNIVIKNNIIQNTYYAGIDLGGRYTNPQSELIEISGNYIKNIWNSNSSGYGMGISITYDAYAVIKDNIIEGVRQGIQTNVCANGGHYTGSQRPTIENNTIITKKVGIWINQDDSSVGWDIINNTIIVDADATDPSYGISFTSGTSPNGTYTIKDNKIDGFLAGIHMWNGRQPGAVIYGGEIKNCDVAIAVSSYHAGYGTAGNNQARSAILTVAEKPTFIDNYTTYLVENNLSVPTYSFNATYAGFNPSQVVTKGAGKIDINGIPQNYTP